MSWLEVENAARIPMTEDAILNLLRRHFRDADTVSLHPDVAPAKELAARRTHAAHLPPRERILALYDAPISLAPPDVRPPTGPFRAAFPSGMRQILVHDGFVVTGSRICWKNAGEPACSAHWTDLEADRLMLDGPLLCLGEDAALLLEDETVQDACANAFHVLALSSRDGTPVRTRRDTMPDAFKQSGAVEIGTTDGEDDVGTWSTTPASPDTASFMDYASHACAQGPEYSCWHCFTPLYETTPECAFCGAEPSETGWLRTA